MSLFNHFSRFSSTFDSIIYIITLNKLIKGGVLLTIFWWGWFKSSKNNMYIRLHLISTLFACILAITCARLATLLLPFRLRPLREKGLDFLPPYGMSPGALEGWSSFPSDHAVLFYALSTGMFFISKKVGLIALSYTTLVIGLPRIYLGLHYPTDIIGGACIGIVISILWNVTAFGKKLSLPTLKLSNTNPEIYYPILFIITYQIVDMFDSSRSLIEFLNSTL